MERETIRQIITAGKITAIIRLDDLSAFQDIALALVDGGIRSLEFTLTNRDALDTVSQLRSTMHEFENGQAVLGIGSVRRLEQAQLAIDAGAQFLVAPVLVPGMMPLCQQHNIVSVPGAYTPTEIETAWQAGADFVKVFPANTLGPAYIKAILAPMPDLRLMPTGGIDLSNIADYMRAGCVGVGVGSSLVKPAWITNRDWQALRDAAREYQQAVGEAV